MVSVTAVTIRDETVNFDLLVTVGEFDRSLSNVLNLVQATNKILVCEGACWGDPNFVDIKFLNAFSAIVLPSDVSAAYFRRLLNKILNR